MKFDIGTKVRLIDKFRNAGIVEFYHEPISKLNIIPEMQNGEFTIRSFNPSKGTYCVNENTYFYHESWLEEAKDAYINLSFVKEDKWKSDTKSIVDLVINGMKYTIELRFGKHVYNGIGFDSLSKVVEYIEKDDIRKKNALLKEQEENRKKERNTSFSVFYNHLPFYLIKDSNLQNILKMTIAQIINVFAEDSIISLSGKEQTQVNAFLEKLYNESFEDHF